jgi:V8-like Glu-specific endopeptidase
LKKCKKFSTIKNKNDIKIIIDNGNKEFNINMNINKRIIAYDDEKDIIGIEIKEEDNIKNNVKFLNYDINCQKNQYDNYLGKDVFILHHPLYRDLECNSGKILTFREDVYDYEFHHNLDTDEGSSGAPILLFENNNEGPKVIGVHKCFPTGQIEYKSNIGNFIDILIKTVIDKLNEKKEK